MQFSLDGSTIDRLLGETLPSFQGTCPRTRNLGFGFVFYGIARALRPAQVAVIGSKGGFAPIAFALALKDNSGSIVDEVFMDYTTLQETRLPSLHFIDPSYSEYRNDPNHWYGRGLWDDAERVRELWRSYGVDEIIQHYKLRSDEFVAQLEPGYRIDLLYVDGDHSYEGIKHDLTAFVPWLADTAVVLAHDVDERCQESKGHQVLTDLEELYDNVRLPVFPGLAIMRPRR